MAKPEPPKKKSAGCLAYLFAAIVLGTCIARITKDANEPASGPPKQTIAGSIVDRMNGAPPAGEFTEGRDYKFVERWDAGPNSLRRCVVLLRDMRKPELIRFAQQMRAGHDDVAMYVFRSDRAYTKCRHAAEEWKIKVCQREFLLVADTARITWLGPYRGQPQVEF